MLKFLADESLNQDIVRGLVRIRKVDFLIAVDAGLGGLPDDELLIWAADQGRIVVSHDVRTMPKFAWSRVQNGERMPGVIIVPASMSVARAIDHLSVIDGACASAELDNQVWYLPKNGERGSMYSR